MSNYSKLKYSVVKPAYFSPFFNFKGLMLKNVKEGSLNSDSDVVRAMRSMEKAMLGDRTVLNLVKEGRIYNSIANLLSSEGFLSIEPDSFSDGNVVYINPRPLGGEVSVCVKNNRIAIQNFVTNSTFGVSVCSQVLTYSNEKYSIGVIRKDLQCGFAIEVCRDDSGIKGGVIAKVIYLDPTVMVIDRLDKYINVSELLKGITG